MTDKTSKTIRDLERLLRQEFGFSSRRSKVGAAVAWKAKTGDEPQSDNHDSTAEFFTNLPDLIAAEINGATDVRMVQKCERALALMREALRDIDDSGGAIDVGAHLSLAIHRLEEAIGEAKRPPQPST